MFCSLKWIYCQGWPGTVVQKIYFLNYEAGIRDEQVEGFHLIGHMAYQIRDLVFCLFQCTNENCGWYIIRMDFHNFRPSKSSFF